MTVTLSHLPQPIFAFTSHPLSFPLSHTTFLATTSPATFLGIIQVLDDRGRGDQLLAEMRVKGLAWDSYTYTALMMGRGDRKEVIRLWEDMVAKAKGGESDADMAGTGLGSGAGVGVGVGSGVLPTQAAAAELFKACEVEVVTGLPTLPRMRCLIDV